MYQLKGKGISNYSIAFMLQAKITMEVGDLHNQEKIRLLIQATISKAMLYPFLETQKK